MSADGIPDVRHPGGMSVEQNSGCETSGWNVRCHTSQGDRLRVQGVGTPPPDDTERVSLSGATPSGFSKRICGALPLSGLLQGEAHDTRDHHTSDDSLSYLDMLSGSLAKVHKPCYSPRSAALRWCVRTPCPDIFFPWIPKNSPQAQIALVIKKLSKHQNLTQFD